MTGNSKRPTRFLVHQHVLRLAEIGRVAIPVQAAYDEAAAHPAGVFARNQNKTCGGVHRLDRDEAVNHWHSEGRVLYRDELLQHLVVEGELMHVVDTIGVEAEVLRPSISATLAGLDQLLQSPLDALGQIE